MLTIFAMAAALAMTAQDAGQWQDFGAGPDGVAVSVNIDSIERGAEGAEAMVRLRMPRATGTNAVQSDILFSFDCAGRRGQRALSGAIIRSSAPACFSAATPSSAGLSRRCRRA